MKKSVVVATLAFALMPLTGCNGNNDQAAYMTSTKSEDNAREAEQAEEEFAKLAAKQEEALHPQMKETKKVSKKDKKSDTKKVAKTESATKQAKHELAEVKEESKAAHEVAEHKASKHEAPETATHETAAKHESPTTQAAHELAKTETTAPKHEATAQTETKSNREPASEKHHAAEAHDHVYTVQLGAFREKANAEKLTAKLKSAGFPAMMLDKGVSKSGELYLVHLEPTPNRSEAEQWQTDLKLKSFDSVLTQKHDQ